ncbi:MAG: hypothetical protein ACE5GN_00670 [Waddliaceae bacterium]
MDVRGVVLLGSWTVVAGEGGKSRCTNRPLLEGIRGRGRRSVFAAHAKGVVRVGDLGVTPMLEKGFAFYGRLSILTLRFTLRMLIAVHGA